MNVLAAADLDDYCAPLREPEVRRELASRTGFPLKIAGAYLDAICNEAHTALRLLEWAGLRAQDRVLEVGAGAGLLTGYLQARGIDLVAIEPTGEGFEATPTVTDVVGKATGNSCKMLPLAARELDPSRHGQFNLIFSVNVLEHFQPMKENLAALAGVMAPYGRQVHTCPNYHVPYEPHYGIPLVPVAPHLTPYFGRRRLRSENVWRSLNFITATDLGSYAKRFGLEIVFKSGTFGEAFERLCAEPAFAARHPRLLRRVAGLMRGVGLTAALKKLPSTWVTPMTVLLRRPC